MKDRWKLICSICHVSYGACIQVDPFLCLADFSAICVKNAFFDMCAFGLVTWLSFVTLVHYPSSTLDPKLEQHSYSEFNNVLYMYILSVDTKGPSVILHQILLMSVTHLAAYFWDQYLKGVFTFEDQLR